MTLNAQSSPKMLSGKGKVGFTAYVTRRSMLAEDWEKMKLNEPRRRSFDFPVRQGIFHRESTFSADSYGVRTPPFAIECINICAHVKDPVVHVRVWRIRETLRHPACIVDWVVRLCRSWLSPGKATRISHGRNPKRTIQLKRNRVCWIPGPQSRGTRLQWWNTGDT